jgi:peptidoglycan/LPS O-acetylase OafA/YrhL
LELTINKGKIYSLQNLRGIAALSVCLFHLISNLTINGPVKYILGLGYLGVPIFFMISGFVIPWSLYKENYKLKNYFSYLLKRFLRIEPPYIISIVMILVLNYFSAKYAITNKLPFHFSLPQFLLHIFYLPTYFGFNWYQDVYHTLLTEFQFYILLGIIFSLLINKKKIIFYSLIACLIIVSKYLKAVDLFNSIDLFLLGMIYFKYKIGHLKNYEFYSLAVIVMVFTLLTNPDRNILGAEFITLIAMMYWNSANKVTLFLGNISYSLYLVHIPIGGRITSIGHHFIHSIQMNYVLLVLALAVSIFCAWVFYKLVELPAIALSKRAIKNYK